MCVSEAYCRQHLSLLFSALEWGASSPTLRANVAVALGDLALRWPNAVEPWTADVYGALNDESPRVRAHALLVLTHLVLNDMVKVKAHVSEVPRDALSDCRYRNRKSSSYYSYDLTPTATTTTTAIII